MSDFITKQTQEEMVAMIAGRTDRGFEEENVRRAHLKRQKSGEDSKGKVCRAPRNSDETGAVFGEENVRRAHKENMDDEVNVRRAHRENMDDEENVRRAHRENMDDESGAVQRAQRKNAGKSGDDDQENRGEVYEDDGDEVEEFKMDEWVGRMATVLKCMSVFTEEIASKVVRIGEQREVMMERFNSERNKADSLLRELEGTEVVDGELAEALDAAGIHTSDMMIRVLENGGKANDIVENLELVLKVGETAIVDKVDMLSEQVDGVVKVLGCEEKDCVMVCGKIMEENRVLKERLRKRSDVTGKIHSNKSVQRLLNRSCYSRSNETLESDGIGTDLRPLKTSTPLGSKAFSPETSLFGNNPEPLEIPRASYGNNQYSDNEQKESVLESLLKAQVMPSIGDFYGNPDEDLERYLRMFMTRYNDKLFSDEILKDVFVEKLKGAAKELYLTIPDRASSLTFTEIVAHLKEGLKRDKRLDEVAAVSQMRTLKVIPGKLLQYCNDMEKLSLKAYPKMNPAELSFIRSEQLYQQVAHWKDSLRLSEILENGSKLGMYDQMKDCALRMERLNNLRIRNIRMGNFVKDETRFRLEQSALPVSKVIECYNCGEKGHRQFECRKPNTVQRPGTGPPRNVANIIHQVGSRPQTVTEMIREAAQGMKQEKVDALKEQQMNNTYYVGGCHAVKSKSEENEEASGNRNHDNGKYTAGIGVGRSYRTYARNFAKPITYNHRRPDYFENNMPFHDNYRRPFNNKHRRQFHDNYRSWSNYQSTSTPAENYDTA